jgi:hypothetical protein
VRVLEQWRRAHGKRIRDFFAIPCAVYGSQTSRWVGFRERFSDGERAAWKQDFLNRELTPRLKCIVLK